MVRISAIAIAALVTGVIIMPESHADAQHQKAVFAGGCFWCVESAFEKREGVINAVSGYAGGKKSDASYKKVSSGKTLHKEAVEVTYDPTKVSYKELLDLFWKNIDPTDGGGQFADRGEQYKTAIFYGNEEERRIAEESKAGLELSGRYSGNIVTEIAPLQSFFPAEDHHQDYSQKNPEGYQRYKKGSGREGFLKKIWRGEASEVDQIVCKIPASGDLKERLTDIQYKVTQENGTEAPFANEYWDNKRDGIYVDVVSGEPLFSSKDKFESGTGWPSFIRPIEKQNIVENKDLSHGLSRTEVRAKGSDSHLGHLFKDGPKETGLRYCVNSAALRFIPKEDLEKEGYGKYTELFEE